MRLKISPPLCNTQLCAVGKRAPHPPLKKRPPVRGLFSCLSVIYIYKGTHIALFTHRFIKLLNILLLLLILSAFLSTEADFGAWGNFRPPCTTVRGAAFTPGKPRFNHRYHHSSEADKAVFQHPLEGSIFFYYSPTDATTAEAAAAFQQRTDLVDSPVFSLLPHTQLGELLEDPREEPQEAAHDDTCEIPAAAAAC